MFPQYAYWLTTGKTLPNEGQISPTLEEIKENIKQAGHIAQRILDNWKIEI